MEDRFLLENMDKDTDRSVRNAIRSAVIKVKGQHGVKNGPWTDAYGDADVLDYAYTFGKESAYTIGLVLLGIVFWPMLGFGESEPVDLEDDSDTSYEVL